MLIHTRKKALAQGPISLILVVLEETLYKVIREGLQTFSQ